VGVAAGVEEEAFTEGEAKELELLTDTLMESTRTLVITVVISIVGDVDTGFSVCEDWLSVGEVAGLLASDPPAGIGLNEDDAPKTVADNVASDAAAEGVTETCWVG